MKDSHHALLPKNMLGMQVQLIRSQWLMDSIEMSQPLLIQSLSVLKITHAPLQCMTKLRVLLDGGLLLVYGPAFHSTLMSQMALLCSVIMMPLLLLRTTKWEKITTSLVPWVPTTQQVKISAKRYPLIKSSISRLEHYQLARLAITLLKEKVLAVLLLLASSL